MEGAAGNGLNDLGRRVHVMFTPSHDTLLSFGHTVHDLPWQAFAGINLSYTAGWKEKVVGTQDEGRCKLKFDLSELKGSSAIEAFRTYIVDPKWGPVVFETGDYQRAFNTYNTIEIYDDDGAGATPSVLKFIGVQVPMRDKSIDAESKGPVIVEIEFVDLISWVLKNLLPQDISAWAIENAGANADGPLQACRSTVYSNGSRVYSHMLGNHGLDAVDPNRHMEFTYYPLAYVYQAIAEAANVLMQSLTRLSANQFHIVGVPTGHWTLSWPDWTATNAASAVTPRPVPSIVGHIQYHPNPGVMVGGFFYAGENAKRDNIGSWDNAFEFLKDTTEGLVAKVASRLDSAGIGNAPDVFLDIGAIKLAHLSGALTLPPSAFAERPKVKVGAGMIAGVSATVPAGKQDDQTKIPVGTSSKGDNEREYALPRTWHTLPCLWPGGKRTYRSSATNIDVYSFAALNCLTLFAKTTAGGLVPSCYIRIHQHVTVSDGVSTYTDGGGNFTLPTPATAFDNEYDSNPTKADADFGAPLRQAYLLTQRVSSTPYVAGLALMGLYGSSSVADYEVEADMDSIDSSQIGNRCDATAFPSGNALLDGETYLGTLPGAPLVKSGEFDAATGKVKARLEGI